MRGGGPSENRFFMDGIEIPNINHFATQGASGGPVSLVNSDLIREIDFYTGAFPADRAGALSSVLDFRLRDGDPDRQRFRATLGASEVGLSGSGHIGEKATFLFSARQSYLQMLFKLLGLPFLPNYIDAQAKVRIRFSQRDELTVLALAGIDNMRLNTDEKGEETEYLLSYLPRLRQETFTVGASYRHYAGRHAQTVTLSHSYLNNRNTKYLGNDESSEDNLTLRLRAVEQKTSLRAENRSHLGRWTLREGVELSYSHYTNRTFRRFFAEQAGTLNYRTRLGLTGWGAFVAADYASAWDNRFVLNLSGTYELPKAWSIGAKLSAIGGAPYTPYDTEKSSLKEAWDARGRPYYDYSRYNEGRLPAFAQLDLRIDKAFYFRRCTLGIYVDLQNVTGSKLRQPDVLMSTGIVENPSAPASEQRYRMKYIKQESGTLVPALGVTVEF